MWNIKVQMALKWRRIFDKLKIVSKSTSLKGHYTRVKLSTILSALHEGVWEVV